jgi:hypothetical protein
VNSDRVLNPEAAMGAGSLQGLGRMHQEERKKASEESTELLEELVIA